MAPGVAPPLTEIDKLLEAQAEIPYELKDVKGENILTMSESRDNITQLFTMSRLMRAALLASSASS